jgi:hypothetical protein
VIYSVVWYVHAVPVRSRESFECTYGIDRENMYDTVWYSHFHTCMCVMYSHSKSCSLGLLITHY